MKIVLILMMLILLGRLFSIMIIKGEEYRYIADNKRVKQIAGIMFLSFALSIIWAFIVRKKENLSVKPLLYIFLFSFFAVLISILMQTIIYFLSQDFLKRAGYSYCILFNSFIHSAMPEEAVKAMLFYSVDRKSVV